MAQPNGERRFFQGLAGFFLLITAGAWLRVLSFSPPFDAVLPHWGGITLEEAVTLQLGSIGPAVMAVVMALLALRNDEGRAATSRALAVAAVMIWPMMVLGAQRGQAIHRVMVYESLDDGNAFKPPEGEIAAMRQREEVRILEYVVGSAVAAGGLYWLMGPVGRVLRRRKAE